MPMEDKEDFGAGDESNKYCVHCTDPEGKLKPRAEVREGMIQLFMKMRNTDRETAEKSVDEHMSKMPAWK